jgi:membrane protease YdiL (CAAX protease family)
MALPDPGAAANSRRSGIREVAAYVGLVTAIVLLVALLLPGTIEEPGPAPLFALLTPAFVVGLIRGWVWLRRRRGVATSHQEPFGLRRLGLRYWPAALVLPVLSVGVSIASAWALGLIEIHRLGELAGNAPVDLVVMTLLLLGEEIGWRGFVLPRFMAVMPTRAAVLVTGLIHGLFHLPLILLTNSYDSAGSRAFIAPSAVVVITLGGVIFGWLWIRSSSLWPVLIAHAVVNTCLIEAPYLTSTNADRAAYYTGEGGLFTIATVGLVALLVVRRAQWTPRTRGSSAV